MKNILLFCILLLAIYLVFNFQQMIEKEEQGKIIYGVASWYGKPFHGREMANGKIFNMNKISFASPFLPLGSEIVVENLANGMVVAGQITDRGPYVDGRILDVSYKAAKRLGMVHSGLTTVKIEVSK